MAGKLVLGCLLAPWLSGLAVVARSSVAQAQRVEVWRIEVGVVVFGLCVWFVCLLARCFVTLCSFAGSFVSLNFAPLLHLDRCESFYYGGWWLLAAVTSIITVNRRSGRYRCARLPHFSIISAIVKKALRQRVVAVRPSSSNTSW